MKKSFTAVIFFEMRSEYTQEKLSFQLPKNSTSTGQLAENNEFSLLNSLGLNLGPAIAA